MTTILGFVLLCAHLCAPAHALHATVMHRSSSSRPSMNLFDSINQEMERSGGKKSVIASHILMKDRAEILLLKEQIDAGEFTFADAARRYSSCPSSAKGGALGQFVPGTMAPAFDDLCFDPDTQVGEVNVCSTSFGNHLVMVVERSGVTQTAPAELLEKQKAAEAAEVASRDPIRAAAEAAAAAAQQLDVPSGGDDSDGGAASARSPRERLAALNELLSLQLISEEEFEAKRDAIAKEALGL